MISLLMKGIETIGEFLAKGAIGAAKEAVTLLLDESKTPEDITHGMKLLQDKIATNHAQEDADLHAKYHPTSGK